MTIAPLRRLALPLIALILQATPAHAGLVRDEPTRMEEDDAYEMVAWAAEGEAQVCLDSEPADAAAAAKAIATCLTGEDKVRALIKTTPDLNAGDRAVIHVLLGELASKRITMGLKADNAISARVCAATETAVHELGQVPAGLIPVEMEAEAAGSRKELAGHLPKCRTQFGTPAGGDPLD